MTANPSFIPHIRQCTNDDCVFRFPVTEFDKNYGKCPKCGTVTSRIIDFSQFMQENQDSKPTLRISLFLDNLRSVFNVGSIFRSADGCGIVKHLYLCGTTPTPEHPKMAKTALGAENTIPWSYHPNGFQLVQKLAGEGKRLTALELTDSSIPVRNFLLTDSGDDHIFIVGNEVTGVDPEILSLAHLHIHLPMHGIKESLNVAIAASILCYTL